MDQKQFESDLEYRLCSEFAGMSVLRLRKLWCDGVMFGGFLLNDPRPRILGSAWICEERKPQEEWRIELLLPSRPKSRNDVKWELLLPPEDVTKWLAVDFERKFIQVEPAATVHDSK